MRTMFRRVHPADHLLLLAPEHELAPGQFARVDAHVAACPSCRARRAQLERVLAPATDGGVAHQDVSAAAHASARHRLHAALRHERRLPASGWRAHAARVRQRAGAPLALAATVLLAAFALQVPRSMSIAAAPPDAERGTRPIPVFTPGAVSTLSAGALCGGARPSRLVLAEARDQVLVQYGMQGAPSDTYELDALITPELGGTTARANLWPQRYDTVWNARVKDRLESLLAGRVCAGTMPLGDAQDALAHDWVGSYKRYFDTAVPLPVHLASTEVDDDLTIVETGERGHSPRTVTGGVLLRVLRFGEPAADSRRVAVRSRRASVAPPPAGPSVRLS